MFLYDKYIQTLHKYIFFGVENNKVYKKNKSFCFKRRKKKRVEVEKMINIQKDAIKKIKDIDVKAESILKDADKNSENIISSARYEAPSLLKSSREMLDRTKAEKIETAKKETEEESKDLLQKGIDNIKRKEATREAKLDAAAEVVVQMFIKKIETKTRD